MNYNENDISYMQQTYTEQEANIRQAVAENSELFEGKPILSFSYKRKNFDGRLPYEIYGSPKRNEDEDYTDAANRVANLILEAVRQKMPKLKEEFIWERNSDNYCLSTGRIACALVIRKL